MSVNKKKVPVKVNKVYARGSIYDKNTLKRSFGLFGILLLYGALSVLVCSMLLVENMFLRVLLNLVVEGLLLLIFFSNASGKGYEDTAKGEVIHQQMENGKEITEKEKQTCFHPLKGFTIGLISVSLFFVIGLILAVTAQKAVTTAGALPSWLQGYSERNEMTALVAYTRPAAVTVTDIARFLIRLVLIPIVSIIGSENKDALLMLERLSPVLVLLPGIAYGIGYLQGPSMRSKIHTAINQNRKKRIRREKKERRNRITPKGPEQLN